MRKIFIILGFILLAAGLLVTSAHATGKDVYYCPMHPHYMSDRPGSCPICHMDLVKKEPAHDEHSQSMTVPGHASVALSKEKQQLIGIKTMAVAKAKIIKTVTAVGHVAYDPELYQAQVEYVESYIAFKRLDRRLGKGTYGLQDAERKLRLQELDLIHMGATPETITHLQNNKFADHSLIIPEPPDNVMVYAQIFENDLGFVAITQEAIVDVPDYHETFKGHVMSIDPLVDPASRTIRVRIKLKNVRSDLKANMFVNITMPVEMGENIVVPRDSVMDTGEEKIVFVEEKPGVFAPRMIETGWSTGKDIVVKSGLKEGERIVTNGNFLLDSESRLHGVLSGDGHHD